MPKNKVNRVQRPGMHTVVCPHIRDFFTGALDKLGIEWRRNNRNCISIAKRASVAALDEFVGPKY